MSFLRVVAGVDNTDEARNILTTPTGIQIVSIDNVADIVNDPLTGTVANNTAFTVTDNREVDKSDFYVFRIVIPDDATNLYYFEPYIATQYEVSISLLEGVTTVANAAALTAINRNRNSSATTTATFAQVVESPDPVTGGTEILSDYIPRDESINLDFGRLILANDTTYALSISGSGKNNNQISVRLDLSVIPA